MLRAKYQIKGIEVDYQTDGNLTQAMYEALGRIFDNLDKLTPPADLTRTDISVREGEIRISEYWGGGAAVLDIDPDNKEVEIIRQPRARLLQFKNSEEFAQIVKKVFADYEIKHI